MIWPSDQKTRRPTRDATLDKDAWNMHKSLSELVRAYQFRDRKQICYYDVSVTQCYAIGMLVSFGAITLNKLATELYLDKSTASRVIDSLERKGYVRRTVDPEDARALKLEVTKTGRKLHLRIEQDLFEEMRGMLTNFEPQVRKESTKLMARLALAARTRFGTGNENCTPCAIKKK